MVRSASVRRMLRLVFPHGGPHAAKSRIASDGLMLVGCIRSSAWRMIGSRTSWLVGVPGGMRMVSIKVRSRRRYIWRKAGALKKRSKSRFEALPCWTES